MQSRLKISILVASAASAALIGDAAAQKGESAAAEALFIEGLDLMKKRAYAEACDKFQASQDLEPSVGALLNLGECREKTGKLASAWAAYREAANLARKRAEGKRARLAERLAKTIEKDLSYLVINVPAEAQVEGLSVARGDAPITQSLWNQRVPVDPGQYVIRVEAPGRVAREVQVTVGPKRDEVVVTLEPLAPEPEPEPPPETPPEARPEAGPGSRPGPEPGPEAMPADVPAGMPLGRKIALGAGAGAAVAIAAGSVFGLQARGMWNDARATCADGTQGCTPEGVALAEDARGRANLATAAFAVGVAAASAGVVLWLLSPPRSRAERSTSDAGAGSRARLARPLVLPVVGPGAGGVQVHLEF